MTETDQADGGPFLVLELPDDPVEGQKPETGGAAAYEAGGLNGDEPAVVDLLGIEQYAVALAKFVLHPDTRPLVIGIHGPWGKGKSTFMGFIENALDREAGDTDPRIVPVQFNAWRYQDSRQIWAGLARTITQRIESELSWWDRLMLRFENAWAGRRSESIAFLFVFVPAILVALLAWIGPAGPDGVFGAALDSLRALFKDNKLVSLGLGGGGAALILFWRLPQLLQPFSQRILEYGQLPDYRLQMGYQHRVLADIQRVYGVLRRKTKRDFDLPVRVVVFIDDLDRCSEEKIVEILQAINLILGASEFFVFLGVASEMLHRAIRHQYPRDDEDADDDFPLRYLEKIIQLSFRLPKLEPEQQNPLIAQQFSAATRAIHDQEDAGETGENTARGKNIPDSEGFKIEPDGIGDLDRTAASAAPEIVQDTVHELRMFLKLHRFLDDNPRVKKHVINIHRLVKILLREPGIAWPRIRQEKLVIWLIFCHRWPGPARQILDMSAALENSPNVLRDWREKTGVTDTVLDEFIALAKPGLPGEDFGENGLLRRAMESSRMATTFKANDG